MNKPIEVTIAGETKYLSFNMFTKVELYRVLFDDPYANPEMNQLLDKINEVNESNHMLMVKAFVYAGIVGFDYATNKFKPSVTMAEVGELVANMSPVELSDFFFSIWGAFREYMGMNIEQEEGEQEEVKKK